MSLPHGEKIHPERREDRWGSLTVYPIWLAGEKPTRHIAIVVDITRKNAEHARKSEEEVLGRTAMELGIWPDTHVLTSYRARVLDMGSVSEMEASFRTKSGRVLDGIVFGESLVLAASRAW